MATKTATESRSPSLRDRLTESGLAVDDVHTEGGALTFTSVKATEGVLKAVFGKNAEIANEGDGKWRVRSGKGTATTETTATTPAASE
jgi:hypothetical protein